MSTEPRRFWRLSLAVCSILAFAAATLGAIGLSRGPELAGATFAADRAVAVAGERLVLRSRQPISEVAPSQVEVRPQAPFTIETADQALAVRFTAPLAYGTTYQLVVRDVRSRQTERTSDWSYSFATPAAELYTLVARRTTTAPDELDEVLLTAGDQQRQILTASGIDEYVVTRGHVVAISHPDDTSSTLFAAPRTAGGGQTELAAPSAPALGLLRASPEGDRFGYTATGTGTKEGREFDNALFIQDATDLSRPPVEVTASGRPLAVQDWLFVPGVAAVLTLDLQRQAAVTYLNGNAAPVPLGSYDQLVGFLPGTTTLLAMSKGQAQLLDLSTGETTTVPPTTDPAADEFAGRRTLISPDDYVQELNQLDRSTEGTRVSSQLARISGGQALTLLDLQPEEGQLLDSGVSPNGQFGWATVLGATAPTEDLTSGASEHATTLIFDLNTGAQVTAAPGGAPTWART